GSARRAPGRSGRSAHTRRGPATSRPTSCDASRPPPTREPPDDGGPLMKKKVIYTLDVAPMKMPGSAGRRVECYRLGNHVYLTGQTRFTFDGKLGGPGGP